jgi:glutathione S-transferase
VLREHAREVYEVQARTLRGELNVVDYKLEVVDFSKVAHKSPDFLKLQPFGQVPVLQDGDFFSLADLAGSEVAGGFSLRIIAEA